MTSSDPSDAGSAEEHRREAMERALGYLSHRPRSRRELERYLRRKGFEERALEKVIARCEELGYVDDRAFAEAFVRDRIRLRPRGAFRLESELREKGIDPELAREAIREAFRQEEVTERELLERVARKQWERVRGKDPRTARRRLVGALRRRGFPAGEIYRIVEELTEERA